MKAFCGSVFLLLAASAYADSTPADKRFDLQAALAKKTAREKNRDAKECVDKETTSVKRSGDTYEFKLHYKDGQCVDKEGELYEYGQFKHVEEFSDCADACIEDVDKDLVDKVRGFDWDCDEKKCRCLYDEGTLDSDNDEEFDKTNTDEKGEGTVKGGKSKDDWYCAKVKKNSDDSSSTDRDSRECVDEDKAKIERDGNKYKFKLFYEDGQCVDKDGELYEYGQFKHVDYFSDCAEACIEDVDEELVDEIRGIDWDCAEKKCRCLYDRGTLDGDNDDEFDKTNKDEKGEGSVKGGKSKDDWYCGKVKKDSDVDVVSERALRGSR